MFAWIIEYWRKWRQRAEVKRRLRRLGCLLDYSRAEHTGWHSLAWMPRRCEACGEPFYFVVWPTAFRREPARQFGYFRYCLLCGASAYPHEENIHLLLEELESGERPAIH